MKKPLNDVKKDLRRIKKSYENKLTGFEINYRNGHEKRLLIDSLITAANIRKTQAVAAYGEYGNGHYAEGAITNGTDTPREKQHEACCVATRNLINAQTALTSTYVNDIHSIVSKNSNSITKMGFYNIDINELVSQYTSLTSMIENILVEIAEYEMFPPSSSSKLDEINELIHSLNSEIDRVRLNTDTLEDNLINSKVTACNRENDRFLRSYKDLTASIEQTYTTHISCHNDPETCILTIYPDINKYTAQNTATDGQQFIIKKNKSLKDQDNFTDIENALNSKTKSDIFEFDFWVGHPHIENESFSEDTSIYGCWNILPEITWTFNDGRAPIPQNGIGAKWQFFTNVTSDLNSYWDSFENTWGTMYDEDTPRYTNETISPTNRSWTIKRKIKTFTVRILKCEKNGPGENDYTEYDTFYIKDDVKYGTSVYDILDNSEEIYYDDTVEAIKQAYKNGEGIIYTSPINGRRIPREKYIRDCEKIDKVTGNVDIKFKLIEYFYAVYKHKDNKYDINSDVIDNIEIYSSFNVNNNKPSGWPENPWIEDNGATLYYLTDPPYSVTAGDAARVTADIEITPNYEEQPRSKLRNKSLYVKIDNGNCLCVDSKEDTGEPFETASMYGLAKKTTAAGKRIEDATVVNYNGAKYALRTTEADKHSKEGFDFTEVNGTEYPTTPLAAYSTNRMSAEFHAHLKTIHGISFNSYIEEDGTLLASVPGSKPDVYFEQEVNVGNYKPDGWPKATITYNDALYNPTETEQIPEKLTCNGEDIIVSAYYKLGVDSAKIPVNCYGYAERGLLNTGTVNQYNPETDFTKTSSFNLPANNQGFGLINSSKRNEIKAFCEDFYRKSDEKTYARYYKDYNTSYEELINGRHWFETPTTKQYPEVSYRIEICYFIDKFFIEYVNNVRTQDDLEIPYLTRIVAGIDDITKPYIYPEKDVGSYGNIMDEVYSVGQEAFHKEKKNSSLLKWPNDYQAGAIIDKSNKKYIVTETPDVEIYDGNVFHDLRIFALPSAHFIIVDPSEGEQDKKQIQFDLRTHYDFTNDAPSAPEKEGYIGKWREPLIVSQNNNITDKNFYNELSFHYDYKALPNMHFVYGTGFKSEGNEICSTFFNPSTITSVPYPTIDPNEFKDGWGGPVIWDKELSDLQKQESDPTFEDDVTVTASATEAAKLSASISWVYGQYIYGDSYDGKTLIGNVWLKNPSSQKPTEILERSQSEIDRSTEIIENPPTTNVLYNENKFVDVAWTHEYRLSDLAWTNNPNNIQDTIIELTGNVAEFTVTFRAFTDELGQQLAIPDHVETNVQYGTNLMNIESEIYSNMLNDINNTLINKGWPITFQEAMPHWQIAVGANKVDAAQYLSSVADNLTVEIHAEQAQ